MHNLVTVRGFVQFMISGVLVEALMLDESIVLINMVGVGEQAMVHVVPKAGQNTTKGSACDVKVHVVSEYIVGVAWVLPVLEDGAAYGQSRVEARGRVVVNGAKSPKVEADGGYFPGAKIHTSSFAASHMQDKGDEDERADDLHVEGCKVFDELHIARVNHFLRDRGGQK